jgi:GNAT superfamily N-acetyltransferase
MVYVDADVAWLGLGATLTHARGRGGQTALLSRRIDHARELGARWCVSETGEDTASNPNPSHRNMVRTGFRVVWSRENWGR